jgi:hypothetical protein
MFVSILIVFFIIIHTIAVYRNAGFQSRKGGQILPLCKKTSP